MSFWGVEVKPGKPFTHYFDRTVGRLRVSQATLGIGSRTARSLVQCNVGSKSPVFLCALLPNKIECCHLDLEFEEADDVVFSVLGPRSVHLSGYYVTKSSSANQNSDTESYGEDIANTDAEASDLGSENDDYGGSFIDDDDGKEEEEEEEEEEEREPKVFTSSPISRNGDAGNKKGNHKGLKKKKKKKKLQTVEPADDINSQESEDETNSTVAVLRNKKPASKCNVIESEDDNNEQESKGDKSYLLTAFGNEIPECRETADKVTVDVAAPSLSGGRDEDCRGGKVDVPVEVTNMSNSCKDCPEPDARPTKTSDHANDPVVGMSILKNVYADDNTEKFTDHDMSQALTGTKDVLSSVSNMNIGNIPISLDHLDEVQVENHQNLKRKKDLEGEMLGECNGSGLGDAGEELKQVVENGDHCASLDLSACDQVENGPKLKKQKKGSIEGEWDDCQTSSHVDGVVELKQDAKATDGSNELLPTTEAIQVLTTIQSIGINSEDGSQPNKKNKKKKKKSKVEDDGTGSMLAKDGDYSIPDLIVGEAKQMVEATPMDKALLATTDKNKDPTTQSIDVISNVSQPEKKRDKKKKKKNKVVEDGAISVIDKDKSVDQCKNISNEDTVEQIKQVVEAIRKDTSLLPTTKQHESPTTRINNVSSDVADGFRTVKKHSSKKARVGDDGTNSMPEADNTMNGTLPPSINDKGTNPESSQSMSFPNGLIVEELAKGKPDGKVATTGRKVKVYYTGMLSENGHTFTPSGATFRFRLGDKVVLPGWNIGIEGMRVGDKRRLTIPPLLGYGSEGLGEQIPPNSWLVYDIELASVHR